MTASSASWRRCWASRSSPTIRASRPTRTAWPISAELEAELAALTKDRNGEPFANELMQNGVPSGAVMEVPDVMEHPHTKHRNMVWEKDGCRNVGNPVKLSRTPPSPRSKPRTFGADTEGGSGRAWLLGRRDRHADRRRASP